MPKFNRRAEILAGGGGERGSLNGTYFPFATFGSGCWYDDDTALVALAPSGHLARVPIATLVPQILEQSRGANTFAAGSRFWLADVAGVGVYGDAGDLLYPNPAGLPVNAVGRDGTRVYTPIALNGWGLHGLNPDGSTFDVPNATPYDVQVLGPGRVIWRGGAYGRTAPRPARADASGVLLVTLNGEDWILYWSESTGVVLQRDGATEGWVLETRPFAFARDVIVLDGAIRMVWSVTDGERPQDLVVCELRDGAISYLRRADGVPAMTPVWRSLVAAPPVPPPPSPPPLPPPIPPQESDDMNPPKVSIKSYDPVIAAGRLWRLVVEDSRNGELITVEKRANDSVHVGIKNAKGEDVSGLLRIVKVEG